jgi:hypothetical protein
VGLLFHSAGRFCRMPIMHAQVIRSFLAELEKLSAAGQMMFWEELQKTAANILEVKLDLWL